MDGSGLPCCDILSLCRVRSPSVDLRQLPEGDDSFQGCHMLPCEFSALLRLLGAPGSARCDGQGWAHGKGPCAGGLFWLGKW